MIKPPEANVRRVRSTLIRTGFVLVTNSLIGAGLGLIFWLLAARFYSPEQVGLGGAMTSILVTLGALAQVNFTNVLNRFLPTAGHKAAHLILFAYGVAALASIIVSLCFLALVDKFVPALKFLSTSPDLALLFVISVATWAIFALQDGALIGLGAAVWVLLENIIYSVVKIALLLVMVGVASDFSPIFLAWTAPTIALVALVNIMIFRHILPMRSANAVITGGIDKGEITRFFGLDYLGSLAMNTTLCVAPLLVLSQAGPIASASYHLCWIVTYSLYLVGRSMGISLVTEGAVDHSRLPSLTAQTIIYTLGPLSALILLIAVGAPLIMACFGESYVKEGTGLLRVLALSSLPWAAVTVYLAVARVRANMLQVAVIQGATLALVLVLGSVFLFYLGLLGIGLAWLLAHTLVLTGILVLLYRSTSRGQRVAWVFELAKAGRDVVPRLPWHRNLGAGPSDQMLDALLLEIPDGNRLRVLRRLESQSDSHAVILGTTSDEINSPVAVLKSATSREGIESLVRNGRNLVAIRSDPALYGISVAVPRLVLQVKRDEGLFLVESAVPGRDGREVLADSGLRSFGIFASATAICEMHDRTAQRQRIDADWADSWINSSAATLRTCSSPLLSSSSRLRAIDCFSDWQRKFWTGRHVNLGLAHGDLSPGNLMFEETGDNGLVLSGIIDWDAARPNAPPGFDLCHLIMTTRMLVTGIELGVLVRSLLERPIWQDDELAWFASVGPAPDEAGHWFNQSSEIAAMVGLVWLHHTSSNLSKATRYKANTFWMAANVDNVLDGILRRCPA